MENQLKKIFKSLFNINEQDICDDTSPDNIEQWDSLSHMKLILAIENEFSVEFDEEEFANMSTFRIIKRMIEIKLKQ